MWAVLIDTASIDGHVPNVLVSPNSGEKITLSLAESNHLLGNESKERKGTAPLPAFMCTLDEKGHDHITGILGNYIASTPLPNDNVITSEN